jgi:hypothetical protein
MIGRVSSTSQPSFSVDSHAGHHFVMTVMPSGKVAITTPDSLTQQEFDRVRDTIREWLDGEMEALVIGNCQVVFANVPG